MTAGLRLSCAPTPPLPRRAADFLRASSTLGRGLGRSRRIIRPSHSRASRGARPSAIPDVARMAPGFRKAKNYQSNLPIYEPPYGIEP
jgi:hypothetical protein